MEALVMTTLEDCKAKFSNVPANAFSHAALIPVAENEPSQLDRIEQRLDSITELLAVLLDSVQAEQEEEVQIDLDGEITERIKHEQEWL
jgi:hypothetical protein